MATRNVTITYPDGDGPRVLAALKAHYGQILDNGVMRDRTNAEALAAFDASVKLSLRHIVQKYERETAAKAASDAIQEVNVS